MAGNFQKKKKNNIVFDANFIIKASDKNEKKNKQKKENSKIL